MSDWPVIEVLVERLYPDVQLPRYATPGSSGVDLCARTALRLTRHHPELAPTGLRLAIPPGYEAQVRPRSGLALRHGITMVNTPGTVDADYRGELGVILINLGPHEVVELAAGTRIAQLVFCPVVKGCWREVGELPASERGGGGFGSTGL